MAAPAPSSQITFSTPSGELKPVDSTSSLESIIFVGTAGFAAAYDISMPKSDGTGFKEVWRTNFKEVNCFHLVVLALQETVLYAGVYGHVFAINPATGNILWKAKPNGMKRSSGLTFEFYDEDKMLVAGNGCVTSISRLDGHGIWSTSLPNTLYFGVTILIQGDMLFAGTYSKVFGLDLKTGNIKWSSNLSTIPSMFPVSLSWFSHTALHNEDILVVGAFGYIWNINPHTGETMRETSLQGTGYHIVTQKNTGKELFIVTHGNCFSIDPVTHAIQWENGLKGARHFKFVGNAYLGLGYPEGSSITYEQRSPDAEPCVFIGCSGHVSCLFANNGVTKWTASLPMCGFEFVSLSLLKQYIFAASWGKLYALDTVNGEILYTDELKGLGHQPLVLVSVAAPKVDLSTSMLIGHYEVQRKKAAAHAAK